jgi:hypothetical protein
VTEKGRLAMACVPDVERFRARLREDIRRWNAEQDAKLERWRANLASGVYGTARAHRRCE